MKYESIQERMCASNSMYTSNAIVHTSLLPGHWIALRGDVTHVTMLCNKWEMWRCYNALIIVVHHSGR